MTTHRLYMRTCSITWDHNQRVWWENLTTEAPSTRWAAPEGGAGWYWWWLRWKRSPTSEKMWMPCPSSQKAKRWWGLQVLWRCLHLLMSADEVLQVSASWWGLILVPGKVRGQDLWKKKTTLQSRQADNLNGHNWLHNWAQRQQFWLYATCTPHWQQGVPKGPHLWPVLLNIGDPGGTTPVTSAGDPKQGESADLLKHRELGRLEE